MRRHRARHVPGAGARPGGRLRDVRQRRPGRRAVPRREGRVRRRRGLRGRSRRPAGRSARTSPPTRRTRWSRSSRRARAPGRSSPAARRPARPAPSSDNRDLWFAGFTPQLATAVWFGYGSNKTGDDPGRRPRAPAGRSAPGVFKQYMDRALEGEPVREFPPRANVGDRGRRAGGPAAGAHRPSRPRPRRRPSPPAPRARRADAHPDADADRDPRSRRRRPTDDRRRRRRPSPPRPRRPRSTAADPEPPTTPPAPRPSETRPGGGGRRWTAAGTAGTAGGGG